MVETGCVTCVRGEWMRPWSGNRVCEVCERRMDEAMENLMLENEWSGTVWVYYLVAL